MIGKSGCMALGMLAATVGAATTEYTEPIYLLGDEVYPISVESGSTDIYSGAITGQGSLEKSGSGTLVLASEDNTFEGGINVNAGTLKATKSGAFGTGKVICSASVSIRFAAPDGVFVNDFGRLSSKTGYSRFTWYFDENTTLEGNVDLPAAANHEIVTAKHGTGEADTGLVVWKGAVTSPGSFWSQYFYGTYQLKGKVKIGSLRPGTADASKGRMELYNSENELSAIQVNNVTVACCGENVLGGAKLCAQGGGSGCNGKFDLAGFNQTISALGIFDSVSARITRSFAGATVDSPTQKATLTIVGRGENKCDTNNLAVIGHVALTLDAPGFRQLFTLRDNTTDGDVHVKNGTMELINGASFTNVTSVAVDAGASLVIDSATPSLFGAVTNLTVAGTLICSENTVTPLGTNAVLALSTDSSVTLPADSTLQVAALTLNGTPVRGEISAGDSRLPQLKGGNIMVRGLDYETSDTWTGKDSATSIKAANNWQLQAVPDFVSGNFSATFAAADAATASATIDCNARFLGLAFTASDGFSFLADSTPRLFSIGTNGVTAAAATGEHSPTYAFNVPVTLTGPQKWDVGEGAKVTLNGGSSAPACTKGTEIATALEKTGTGTLELAGQNVWDGQLAVRAGDVLVSGTITTSSGPDDIKFTSGNDSKCWESAQALFFHMGDGGTLSLSNAVIEKATMIQFGDDAKYRPSVSLAGTTNRFNSFFRTVDASRQSLRVEQDSEVIFAGGGRFNYAFGARGAGTVIFRNLPFEAPNGNSGFYVVGGAHAVFEVGNNQLVALSSGISGESGGSFDLKADNVLTETGRLLKLYSASKVNVYRTIQHFSSIAAVKSELTGEEDSLIVLTDGAVSQMSGSIFSGAVSYCHASTNTMTFSGADSTSTGSLEVRNGTVVFAADASWLSVSNVVVTGQGRLVLSATAEGGNHQTFGKETDLYLSGSGVLSIPAGVVQKVNRAFAGNDEIPIGRYTYATAPAILKPHLDPDAGGTLAVIGNPGLLILFR